MSRSNFGHIQRVSKGKYRIYWDGPPKPDGRRNQRSRTVDGTRDDAEVELARIRAGMKGAPRSATLHDYWLLSVEPTLCALEPKTAHEYRRLWAREIEPRLGGVRVDALTQTAAQAAIGAVGSPSAQRSTAALLKKVCNMAIGDMRTVYSTLHGEAGSPDSLVSLSMGHSDGTTRGRNYQKHTRRGMALIADCLTDYLLESAPCYEMLRKMFL